MASKEQPEGASADLPDDATAQESDDGYYEGRHRKAMAAREDKKPGDAKAQPKSSYEQFMEDHWVGWMQPVLGILVLGGGALAYRMHWVQESFAGVLVALGLVVLAIYSFAMPALDLLVQSSAKIAFGLVVALWAFSSGYPTLWRAGERPAQGEARLTEAGKPTKVTIDKTRGGQGPYLMVVTGHIKPTGQETTVNYEVTVKGTSGAEEKLEGKLEYSTHQTQGRRGRSQWAEVRNQEEFRLPDSLTGAEIEVAVDSVDPNLEDGLTVRFYPRPLNPWIFWGTGIFVVLAMMAFEARIGDAQTKTHLTMAAAATLIFAARFYNQAIPGRLVMPAVEAVFVAAMVGGIGGTLLGWIMRKLGGRDKIRVKGER